MEFNPNELTKLRENLIQMVSHQGSIFEERLISKIQSEMEDYRFQQTEYINQIFFGNEPEPQQEKVSNLDTEGLKIITLDCKGKDVLAPLRTLTRIDGSKLQ